MNEAAGRVLVLGAGGWGTALAVMLAGAGREVTLWARRPDLAAELDQTRENADYLPGVPIPPGVQIAADLGAVAAHPWALLTVPSKGMRALLEALPGAGAAPDFGVVLCAKGLAEDGGRLSDLATRLDFARVAVLSGPNHAEEVARGLPAATVVASADAPYAGLVQRALMTASLRVYTSSDVPGAELGGVLKNVMALAAGLVDGLGLGDNAKAALITRGLIEMRRYLAAQGAREETVYGLSGLGDLVATATSPHSRNRAAGEAIARGQGLAADPEHGPVVEGIRTAQLLHAWASERGFDLPIVRAVADVVAGRVPPEAAAVTLMGRDAKAE